MSTLFANRTEAGRALAARLADLAGDDLVVLGLPRGGVVVAVEVARTLGASLDVLVVRKLGVPRQPELAMGAIAEAGVRLVSEDVVRAACVTPEVLAGVERRERDLLRQRLRLLRGDRPPVSLANRAVVVVDDGIATGSTVRVACAAARARGAVRVLVAVPVAPADTPERLRGVADDVVLLHTPEPFLAIGPFYRDFSQTSDAEVVDALQQLVTRTEP